MKLAKGPNACSTPCATCAPNNTDSAVPLSESLGLASPGLVSYWPLNGNTTDAKGTNNGTLEGGATVSSVGKFNQAAFLDGTNDYIKILSTSTMSLPGNYSFSVWIKSNSTETSSNRRSILGALNNPTVGFSLHLFNPLNGGISGGNELSFYNSNADIGGSENAEEIYSGFSMPQNVWKNVIYVRDGSVGTFYVDGLHVYTGPGYPLTFGSYFGIGAAGAAWTGGWLFKGLIDDVAVWSRALDECEIKKIAKGPNGCAQPCGGGSTGTNSNPHSYTIGTARISACNAVDLDLVPVVGATSYKYYTGLSSTTLTLATTTTSTTYTDYSHTGPGTFYYANKVVYAGGVESATSSVATTTLQACTIAQCGTRETLSPYAVGTTAWPSGSTYCAIGTSTTPAFPTISNNPVSWSCLDNRGLTRSCSGTLLVNAPSPMNILNFFADRSVVAVGQSCQLNWETTYNNGDCRLNGGDWNNVAVVASSTSATSTQPIVVPTTYTLTCSHSGVPTESRSLTCRMPGGIGED
jgi:hypothetical protein